MALARRDLDRTRIVAPFDLLVATVQLEPGQCVRAGETLFESYATATTKIDSEIDFPTLRHLLPGGNIAGLRDALIGQQGLTSEILAASVMPLHGATVESWPAAVAGVRETIEGDTRTFRLIVRVHNPYTASTAMRPPLVKGTYCAVELRGSALSERLVIPTSARHGEVVYVLDDANRLQRAPVVVDFMQGEMTVLASGLTPGQRLIVADPTPAIDGQHVEPLPDKALEQRLTMLAQGEGALR